MEDEQVQDTKKFTFALGSVPQRTKVELQLKEVPEEKDYIHGIDSTGKILGGKKKEPRPVIRLEEGWVGKYKAYNYQKIAKIARGELPEEEEEDTNKQSPELNHHYDVMQVESLDEHGKLQIDDEDYNYIMSLPPLLRNRPPGLDKIEDERDKFLFDVMCRPDVADLSAYERMPLEKFGEAMLRGMGWREGMPIGKNSTRAQEVKQIKPRPNRLGLGATPQPEKKPEGWIPKPGESRDPKSNVSLPKDKNEKVSNEKLGNGMNHSGLRDVQKQSKNATDDDKEKIVPPSDLKLVIDSNVNQDRSASKHKKEKNHKKRKHSSSSSHKSSKKLKKTKKSSPSEPTEIAKETDK